PTSRALFSPSLVFSSLRTLCPPRPPCNPVLSSLCVPLCSLRRRLPRPSRSVIFSSFFPSFLPSFLFPPSFFLSFFPSLFAFLFLCELCVSALGFLFSLLRNCQP